MSIIESSNRTYRYKEEELSEKPIYVRKEKHEGAVFTFLDQDKIRKEGKVLSRTGNWSRMAESPLSIEVKDYEVIAILKSNLYIYNQKRGNRPLYDSLEEIEEIEWNSQDSYMKLYQIEVTAVPFTFDTFNLERYRDNTYRKEIIDTDSKYLSEEVYSIPSILQGRESFEETVKSYKTYFFLLPALEEYCTENENLDPNHNSSVEVESFLREEKESYFDMESFSGILPSEYNPNAPNLTEVQTYIENFELENIRDLRR